MKLQMHSIHFDADQKLLDYIQKKAEKLDTFYDRITGGEVFLRINKDTNLHENKASCTQFHPKQALRECMPMD